MAQHTNCCYCFDVIKAPTMFHIHSFPTRYSNVAKAHSRKAWAIWSRMSKEQGNQPVSSRGGWLLLPADILSDRTALSICHQEQFHPHSICIAIWKGIWKTILQYWNCCIAFNQFLLQQLICSYTASQDILPHCCLHFFFNTGGALHCC